MGDIQAGLSAFTVNLYAALSKSVSYYFIKTFAENFLLALIFPINHLFNPIRSDLNIINELLSTNGNRSPLNKCVGDSFCLKTLASESFAYNGHPDADKNKQILPLKDLVIFAATVYIFKTNATNLKGRKT